MLAGYGVGSAGSVVGSVTGVVVSVGVGAAVVDGGAGAEVVGADVGLLVAGVGVGLLVVAAGDVLAAVGAAVEAPGVADDFAEALGATVAAPAVAVGPQVTVYAAGLDAATAGEVTTRTTLPDAGTQTGNVSGLAACAPAELKISWTGVVFVPSDIAQ
jgi:hypothetical protein